MRVKLVLGYDGTDFCGWQVQPRGRSVQGEIERAIKAVTGETVRVTASGRTDAGVHAAGQVAHFGTENTSVGAENFYKAINAFLPPSIRIFSSERAEEGFDAMRSAKRKTYRYSAYTGEVDDPLKDRYAVRLRGKPDAERMRSAAKIFLGEHDFGSMCASGSGAKSTVRTIYDIRVEESGRDITFFVTGNGFLYNMVRILAGTLIAAGCGDLSITDLKEMLEKKDRSLGGKTLPARGLCLLSVEYD